MESLITDDFLAEFEEPNSPGVSSVWRQCLGSHGSFDDADSMLAVGAELPQTNNGADLFAPQQPACHASMMLENSRAQCPTQISPLDNTPGGSCAQFPQQTASSAGQINTFSLGTNPYEQFPATSAHVAEGRRRRGRKPLPRLPDLQERLNGLTAQFRKLSEENLYLKKKLKILERVVPYRDESVSFLTQLLSTAQAAGQISAGAHEEMDARAPAAWPKSPDSPSSQDQSLTVSGNDSSARSSGPGAAATGSEAQSSRGRASAAAGGTAAISSASRQNRSAACDKERSVGPGKAAAQSCGGRAASSSGTTTPVVLALCPSPDGTAPQITLAALEELKRITPSEFRMLWKHVCLQLGVLVTGAEVHGPGSPPYVRLERFLERALAYIDKLTLLSPACFVQSMYMNVESGQPERPNDNFWITCARSLNLTPQQLTEVHSLAEVYEQNVVPVVQQRLQLAMQLSTRLAAATSAQSSTAGDALTALSSVDELAKQLERNVLKEHQTHWDIGDFLCSSVLSPLQVAKALTVAYPYIPDGVAMMHAFKIISSNDAAQQQAAAAAAAQQHPAAGFLGASGQAFPSLAGLLAGQLPALAGLMASGGLGAAAGRAGGAPFGALAGVQAVAGSASSTAAAGLAGLVAGLPPAQLQALLTALPPGQLQAMIRGMQPAQIQVLAGALQPAQRQAVLAILQMVGAPGRPAGVVQPTIAAAPAPARPPLPPGGSALNPQLQALAALLGANAVASGGQGRARAAQGVPAGLGTLGLMGAKR